MARKVEAAMVGNDLVFFDTGVEILTPRGGRAAVAPDAAISPVTLMTVSESVGGSSFLHQASLTLADAAIRGLYDTYATVVAAPGANLVVVPQAALVSWVPESGGGYSNTSGVGLGFQYGDNGTTLSIDVPFHAGGIGMDGDTATYSTTDTAAGLLIGNGYTGVVNQAFKFRQIGGSQMTGGASGNQLIVSLTYLLFNVATGEFE